ncbi:hypothetical protein JXA40_00055 [bacterium]|nr:hypothetical protein [candidate division CSSED10-310 bacterium]
MNLPVVILLSLGGLFILVFFLFYFSVKKQEKKARTSSLKSFKSLDIQMTDAAESHPKKPAPESPVQTPEPHTKSQTVPLETVFTDREIPTVTVREDVNEPDFGGMADYSAVLSGDEMNIELEDRTPDSDMQEPEIILEDNTIATTQEKTKSLQDQSGIPGPKAEKTESMPQDLFGDDEGDFQTTSPVEEEISPEDIFGYEPEQPAETEQPVEPVKPVALEQTAKLEHPPESEQPDEPAKTIEPEKLTESMIDSLFESTEQSRMKTQPLEPEPAPTQDPEDEKRHEKAKRIARVIVNDIRNYNTDRLAEGIRVGNIMKTLGVEIERGRQLYIKRVPPDIARTTNYYRESLIKLLADGRTDLFGWQ